MRAACTAQRYNPNEPADRLARVGVDSFHHLFDDSILEDSALFTLPQTPANPLSRNDLLMRRKHANMRGSRHGERVPYKAMPLKYHVDYAITCALRNGGVLDVDRAFPYGVPQPYQFCKNLCRSYFLCALWRMMLRKIPMRDCARILNTPLSTCYRWRQEVFSGIVRSFEGLPFDAPAIQLRARQMSRQ